MIDSDEASVNEAELTLHRILRKSAVALHDANQAFAVAVECCVPEAELLGLAHEVAQLQAAYRQANAAVPWHVKVRHLRESTTTWLTSSWSTTV